MLKRVSIFLITINLLYGTNIHTLLRGVSKNYQSKIDMLSIEESSKALEMVNAQFWPKIEITGGATHYNSPTNLRPTTPTENAKSAPDLPFSKDVTRVGARLSMPIFVASLFTLSKEKEALRESTRANRELNLLKDKATLIGANANLEYLERLEYAINSKAKTLKTTKKIILAKIKTGRASKSDLYKIQNRLNVIKIALNSIKIQKANTKAIIETLSGIRVHHSVRMRKIGSYHKGNFIATKPLKAKLRADELALKAEKEKLYPSLSLEANINRMYGESYASGRDIHRDYGGVGINFRAPLVDMTQIKNIQRARVHLLKSSEQLAKANFELKIKAKNLATQLKFINRSMRLNLESIRDRKKLLKIAQTSYKEGRMTIEEYLRYLDDLYDAKAEYYKAKALYWQNLAQIAFIYGNHFERIIK